MDHNVILSLLENLPTLTSAKFRLKLRTENELTDWGEWLTQPVCGYLELGGYGPVSIKDIEWIDIRIT